MERYADGQDEEVITQIILLKGHRATDVLFPVSATISSDLSSIATPKVHHRISEKIVKDSGCALFCLQWRVFYGILNLHICMQIREVR